MNKANKLEAIKSVAQKLNFTEYLKDNPASDSLKRAIKKQREVLENNLEEEKLLETAKNLKHRIWILVNKWPHITDEKEKAKFNEAIRELEELTKE